MNNIKILFVIPTLFCNSKQTIDCVNSLLNSLENTIHNYDIWVIANIESQMFNDWNPPTGVDKDCSDLEFNIAKALNLGISKKTDHDYFCFIDEGMRFDSGWLDSVYNVYNKYDNVGMIGNRPHRIFKHYHIKLEENVYEILWSDGIIFTKFDRIETVNGFDESYFGDCETQDFCYRLINKGYKNLFLSSDGYGIQHHTTNWEAKTYNVNKLMFKAENSRKLCNTRWKEWKESKYMDNLIKKDKHNV